MNLTAEQAQIDRIRDDFILRMAAKYRVTHKEKFEDWLTYFKEAYKHPNDDWVRQKAEDALKALHT